MPATAPTLPCPGITPSRPSALGLAARWVGVTNLALLGLILLVAFGGTLGRWPLVVSSALLSAAWAGASAGLLLAWRHPVAPRARAPAGRSAVTRGARP